MSVHTPGYAPWTLGRGSAQTQIPRMFTTHRVLGLGLVCVGVGEGELVPVPGDGGAVGVGLAERLCRPAGWLATGAGPLETAKLTAVSFETRVPCDGFVEITSFFGTDADDV